MAKAFEMSFQIGGKLASSFTSVFSKASKGLVDLKNQSRQTQRALDQLGNDFRRGKIHQSQYEESTRRLTRELERFERTQKRINSLKTGISNGVQRVKTTAKVAAVGTAAAATGLAYNSMNKAADFESQMTKAGVKAEATAAEMKKMSDTALKLGANSSLSASQVAVAMDELAAKGFNAKKTIAAMPGIIAAAESSGEDLALTSDVVTSALNAFEMKASKANHVADVMAMSANRTAAGVADLGYSFKYAAAPANTLGWSLESLATATGIMVDKGLAGEQAGTSLRMALTRLSKPPKEAREALKKLNISVTDSNGKFKDLTQLTAEWNKATKKLSQTQKVQYAATVFGTDAYTGMLSLFAAGPKKIDEMTKSLENSNGAAAKAAKAMKDNYGGALEQLSGSIESAQIKFATPILPVFQDVFSNLSSSIDDNMGSIEKAGERVAAGLRDILDPFAMKKPEMPKLDPKGNQMMIDAGISVNSAAMAKYQKDLKKYNMFKGMDFGDKVVYMLDEASAKVEQWLSGSGGESMNKIFTKLGEIAAKAWLNAFKAALKSSASNLFDGNFAAALGTGAAAWMMGGGLLAKGGMALGKGAVRGGKAIYGKVKNAKAAKKAAASGGGKSGSSKAPIAVEPASPKNKKKASAVVAKKESKKTASKSGSKKSKKAAAAPKAKKAKGGVLGFFGKIGNSKVFKTAGKALSKAALPLAAASSVLDIFKSKDKTKAAAKAGGGAVGGWGGAKLGAAIGSAILPGLGTAIGGALGGIGGYAAGSWIGGKTTDAARGKSPVVDSGPSSKASASVDSGSSQALASNIQMASQNFATLAMYAGKASGQVAGPALELTNNMKLTSHNFTALTQYSGQASGWMVGAFTGIKSSADMVKNNLDVLTSYTGQASGWLASLSGIQPAANRVINALNELEAKIKSIQLPGAKGNKRTQYE